MDFFLRGNGFGIIGPHFKKNHFAELSELSKWNQILIVSNKYIEIAVLRKNNLI